VDAPSSWSISHRFCCRNDSGTGVPGARRGIVSLALPMSSAARRKTISSPRNAWIRLLSSGASRSLLPRTRSESPSSWTRMSSARMSPNSEASSALLSCSELISCSLVACL